MDAVGFIEAREHWKQGGRMAHWLYQKGDAKQKSCHRRSEESGLPSKKQE